MPTPAGVPAAAAIPLRGLLTGPARSAVLRGVFPTAVYLDVGDDVVAIVTTDALRLPCGLVLAAHSSRGPFEGIDCGGTATVGDGAVVAGDQRFVVRRWWHPRRARTVHPGHDLAIRSEALAALLPPPPVPLLAAPVLAAEHVDQRHAQPPTVAPAELVGLGPGLTPAGDDFLAGLLLTLAAAPSMAAQRAALTAATCDNLARTTALSATLLRHAAAGRGIPEVLDLVDALTGAGDLEAAALRLLGVGHSSGPALAHGVLEAIRLVNAASADPRATKVA